jgi:hypothetical protein
MAALLTFLRGIYDATLNYMAQVHIDLISEAYYRVLGEIIRELEREHLPEVPIPGQ